MKYLWIFLACLFTLSVLTLVIAYVCYRITFFANRKSNDKNDEIEMPKGKIYDPFKPQMTKWIKEVRDMPCKEFSITSFDGLNLFAKYYEYAPDAPIELMFHGYRGTAERDLSGGVQRCFKLGRSAFIVDQRCSGKSEGNTITFGIKEHRDCLKWVDFLIYYFGKDVKIILTGISMGASTVLTAAGKDLPENVVGVLADCGFNSPKDIIKKVAKQMNFPPKLCYPFIKLGAFIFGHFDLEEISPETSLKNCKIPVIFFHGDADDFVPHTMSEINYEACASRKKIVIIKNAGHGLCYLCEPDTYLNSLKEFFEF